MSRPARLAELSLTFSETAFLLWETKSPNHEFAEWFNRLYELSLARENDMKLSDGTTCPFFLYYDEPHALLYALIDNSQQGLPADFARYDKIMLINGRDAFERQQEIYNDYATHAFPPADDDLLQLHRYEMLMEARSNIFTVHYFDYRSSKEAWQRGQDELMFVRHNNNTATETVTEPTRRHSHTTPIPNSSLLTAVRNPQNRNVRNALNKIYQLFEDILYAMDRIIYGNYVDKHNNLDNESDLPYLQK